MSLLDEKIGRFWDKVKTINGVPTVYHYGEECDEKSVTAIVERTDEEATLLYASLTSQSEIGVFTLYLSEVGRLPEKGDWLTVGGVDYVLQPREGKKLWKWADTTHTAYSVQGLREDREDE